ncbi:MAG: hypothetical protein AAB546_00690 [Patescibacteria group bacterium]
MQTGQFVSPPNPANTSKKFSPALIVVAAVVLLAGLGYFGYQYIFAKQTPDSDNKPQPTLVAVIPAPEPTANWTERKFENLKLTFKAPSDLAIGESELEPNQFTGYLQNDKIGEEFFLMDFVYQKSGKKVSQSDIQTFKNDPRLIIPGTARDISLDGYVGFAGQVNDRKSKFITAVVKDGYWLLIYITEPTQTNKELSDQIMSTFKFLD